MLARISRRLHEINGNRSLFFEFHTQYSTTAAAAKSQKGFLEEYLINSLGFSKQEAISASIKVKRSNPITKDPALVVNFFEDLGMNRTHIKSIVSTLPQLLLCKLDKTLKPKIIFLQDLGISGSDLVKFIMAHKSLLADGLNSHIRPRIEYLRKLLGNDDKVAIVLKKCPTLLVYHAPKTVAKNVELLRKLGFSSDNVLKFVVRNPRQMLMQRDQWFLDVAHRVENELGITRDSAMFFYGVEVLGKLRKSTIDAKCDVLRSFGWSDLEISRMMRNCPMILGLSEAKLRKALNFCMKELGYTSHYLASRHSFFSLNLERRVKLRNEVLKVLNEKKLNKRKATLYTVVQLPEVKFINDYLLPYKDEIPEVSRSYIEGVRGKIEK